MHECDLFFNFAGYGTGGLSSSGTGLSLFLGFSSLILLSTASCANFFSDSANTFPLLSVTALTCSLDLVLLSKFPSGLSEISLDSWLI